MKKRPVGRPRKYANNAARCRAYRQRLKRAVYLKSECQTWETPQDFFDALHAEFGFTLDVCAMTHNAKCDRYFSPEQDGLQHTWDGVCWCNPPYGREVGQWIRKAYEASKAGATVVMLLPSRTGTRIWHDYVFPYAEIRWLDKRITFVGANDPAPFDSAVVIFRPPIG